LIDCLHTLMFYQLCCLYIILSGLSCIMSLTTGFGLCRLCVIAGNISPIDVITHVPILCEEANIPYIYVPSKEDLATAGTTKRPTCCVLVMTKPAKGEINEEVKEKLKSDYDHVVAEVAEVTSSMF
jgi:H/ACA ribonucleoprotein complex subunit 2